jgi:hypothetical protein
MENPPTEKKNPNQLLYWILGGGFGCATLSVCLIGACVIGSITLFSDAQPTKFTGSWKGRFNFRSGPEDIVYILEKNGTFRQESYMLDVRLARRGSVAQALEGDVSEAGGVGSGAGPRERFLRGRWT